MWRIIVIVSLLLPAAGFAEEITQLIFLASGEPFVQFMQRADFMTEKIYLPGLFLQPVVKCRVVRLFLSDDNIPAAVSI